MTTKQKIIPFPVRRTTRLAPNATAELTRLQLQVVYLTAGEPVT